MRYLIQNFVKFRFLTYHLLVDNRIHPPLTTLLSMDDIPRQTLKFPSRKISNIVFVKYQTRDISYGYKGFSHQSTTIVLLILSKIKIILLVSNGNQVFFFSNIIYICIYDITKITQFILTKMTTHRS